MASQPEHVSSAAQTRLVRAGKGYATIHKPTCRYSTNGLPWNWAEDKADVEWIDKEWLRPCKVCLPDLAAERERLTLISEEDWLHADE